MRLLLAVIVLMFIRSLKNKIMYKLEYYISGELYEEKINANLFTNVAEYVIQFIADETSNPDTTFCLKDENGNVIFTEENFELHKKIT